MSTLKQVFEWRGTLRRVDHSTHSRKLAHGTARCWPISLGRQKGGGKTLYHINKPQSGRVSHGSELGVFCTRPGLKEKNKPNPCVKNKVSRGRGTYIRNKQKYHNEGNDSIIQWRVTSGSQGVGMVKVEQGEKVSHFDHTTGGTKGRGGVQLHLKERQLLIQYSCA